MLVVSLSLIHYKIFYLKSKHDALPKNLPNSLKRMCKTNKKWPTFQGQKSRWLKCGVFALIVPRSCYDQHQPYINGQWTPVPTACVTSSVLLWSNSTSSTASGPPSPKGKVEEKLHPHRVILERIEGSIDFLCEIAKRNQGTSPLPSPLGSEAKPRVLKRYSIVF